MGAKRCIECGDVNHDELSSYCMACQGTDWWIALHSNVELDYSLCLIFDALGACPCSYGETEEQQRAQGCGCKGAPYENRH